MKRVVFFSVLMIFSLTAAARNSHAGVVADTSVIPGRPLAERLEGGTKTGVKKERTDVGAVNAEKTTVKKSPPAKTGATTVKKTTSSKDINSGTSEKKPTVTSKTTTSKDINTGTESSEKKPAVTSKTSTNTTGKKTTTPKDIKTATESNEKKATITSKTSTAKKTTTPKDINTGTESTKKTATATAKTKISSKSSPAKKTSSKSKPKTRKLHKGIGIELFTPLAFKYAILLDVPVEKIEDEKLLEVLDHWYGTRYRYGGETRKGIDCSAFTQAFMLGYFDYDLPRTADEQYQKSKRIKKKKLRQGDLVFFKTRGAKNISHVGVYLLNDRFVHSATSTGVRISKLSDDYYQAKYAGAGRIR